MASSGLIVVKVHYQDSLRRFSVSNFTEELSFDALGQKVHSILRVPKTVPLSLSYFDLNGVETVMAESADIVNAVIGLGMNPLHIYVRTTPSRSDATVSEQPLENLARPMQVDHSEGVRSPRIRHSHSQQEKRVQGCDSANTRGIEISPAPAAGEDMDAESELVAVMPAATAPDEGPGIEMNPDPAPREVQLGPDETPYLKNDTETAQGKACDKDTCCRRGSRSRMEKGWRVQSSVRRDHECKGERGPHPHFRHHHGCHKHRRGPPPWIAGMMFHGSRAESFDNHGGGPIQFLLPWARGATQEDDTCRGKEKVTGFEGEADELGQGFAHHRHLRHHSHHHCHHHRDHHGGCRRAPEHMTEEDVEMQAESVKEDGRSNEGGRRHRHEMHWGGKEPRGSSFEDKGWAPPGRGPYRGACGGPPPWGRHAIHSFHPPPWALKKLFSHGPPPPWAFRHGGPPPWIKLLLHEPRPSQGEGGIGGSPPGPLAPTGVDCTEERKVMKIEAEAGGAHATRTDYDVATCSALAARLGGLEVLEAQTPVAT